MQFTTDWVVPDTKSCCSLPKHVPASIFHPVLGSEVHAVAVTQDAEAGQGWKAMAVHSGLLQSLLHTMTLGLDDTHRPG